MKHINIENKIIKTR